MDTSDDIKQLLRSVGDRFDISSDSAHRMLGMLIHTALQYRDQLVAEHQPPLTIGETRQALDAFMLIMKTKQFPDIAEERIKKLVLLWLEDIKHNIHH